MSRYIRDSKTGNPIAPMRQPGYYPGYSTLEQRKFWDATTRRVVEHRVNEVPPIRFFLPEELPTMTAIVSRILPQDDRLPEWQIPILNYIDERLFKNEIDGYQYEDMPSDRDAYRLGIRAIDETAKAMHGEVFAQLNALEQDHVLKSIHDGEKRAAEHIWAKMSIKRFWALLVQDCVKAYYAHPWAWDEIGYGGPAYPRAYMRLEGGMPEPWEVDEARYQWDAPANSLSDALDPGDNTSEPSHPGQGGTH
ncbi:MAG: gluconate 2-dehydrogenase subunit 3 family protein [Acidobacteriaceae bacterium]|nr:gluconate 2-dehydrogenase subunit 3 family protein [Acidobacteriaceae bacterium]